MRKIEALATAGVQSLSPYLPGKPVEELQRELGIENIVKLASNENPLGMSERAANAISGVIKEGARYPDGNGFSLKAALKHYYEDQKSQTLELNQLTLGNGSNDVLDIIARCFAGPGDEIIFSQYAFAVYAIACKAVGAKAVMTDAKEWGHDLLAMQEAITEKTKLIFIANPNNPTGTALQKEELLSFLAAVPERVIVVLDEAYIEYNLGNEFPDGLELLANHSNLIVTRTFSKAWGLASLRVGYAVSNPQIADVLNRVRQPFNVNSFALAAAVAVLKDQEYLQKGIEVNRLGLVQITEGLEKLNLAYIPSKGNFVCFQTQGDAQSVYEELLKLGVIVRPVANYGMSNFLRVSVGLEAENRQFLDSLTKVMS